MRLPGFLQPRGQRRTAALGLLSSGIICPCHALVGLLALASGASVLTPAEQDGVHAAYVPMAVLIGAVLLRRDVSHARKSSL